MPSLPGGAVGGGFGDVAVLPPDLGGGAGLPGGGLPGGLPGLGIAGPALVAPGGAPGTETVTVVSSAELINTETATVAATLNAAPTRNIRTVITAEIGRATSRERV